MSINSINFNTSFKSTKVFGYDDEISALRREGMRQRIEDRELYNVDYFLKEGRKSEFDEKKMTAELTKKPKRLSPKDVRNIACNVSIIDGDKNLYRGSSLCGKNKALKTLKDAGVETVISFVLYPIYEKNCKKNGLKYKEYLLGETINNPAFMDKKSYMKDLTLYMSPEEIEKSSKYLKAKEKEFDKQARNYIDDFVDFIQTVQKGNCYMGCDYGTYRTDRMVLLNMLFNPQSEEEYECLDEIYPNVLELYDKLTPEDKAKMGWTKEFDENFIPKIDKINNYYDDIYASWLDED